jgi:radical SAM superfamily enzyme YgiQ (UPF0313 family)
VIYVADHVHRQRPQVRQEILDLALVEPGKRRQVLKSRLLGLRPDVVAFSWRNMQSFGPHPEDDALDVVMDFDHSDSVFARLRAARSALRTIYDYAASRQRNFGFMRLVKRVLPESRLVVGGTAVSIFAAHVADKAPEGTLVVVGEGEDAMVSIVDGASTVVGDHLHKGVDGGVSCGCREAAFPLEGLAAVDFGYIASIFPQFHQYLDGHIGVQTKRGCPFQCHFCLYNQIEGCRQRYREPLEVAKEIATLEADYGVRKIWFTDAQFFSTKRSTRHAERLIDELVARDLRIEWTGFLRFNHLTAEVARKMFRSGLSSIDTTFTGSQQIIDTMTLGYSLAQQMQAL